MNRPLGEYQKNMTDDVLKEYGKYTGKDRSTAKILPIPHPMVAPALAPRHPLPESVIPKATAAAH
jgi:hypothetical protein